MNDPIASIEAWIKDGYADGAWDGPGINSSAIASADAATGLDYGIGYADSADPGDPAGLPSGELEVKFTLLGDANLDGTVNAEDFTPFSANLGASGAVWDEGDFNYDGNINAEDFTPFSQNLNQSANQAGNLATAASGSNLSNVPEPASVGLMVAAGLGILGRRSRAQAGDEIVSGFRSGNLGGGNLVKKHEGVAWRVSSVHISCVRSRVRTSKKRGRSNVVPAFPSPEYHGRPGFDQGSRQTSSFPDLMARMPPRIVSAVRQVQPAAGSGTAEVVPLGF